ncbi:MAG: SDR family NAD(P)-dependent oxidoreductase [Planctomycetia bacterium]|nr:SDR family NAD(P)-dependent oxidoreductase [Planctomycetia bacterium]
MHRAEDYANAKDFFDAQWPLEENEEHSRITAATEEPSRLPWLLPLAGLGAWLVWRGLRREPTFTLCGKHVLITGGSRGLGLLLAREASRQGARVAVCARDPEELNRAYDDLASRGAHVLAIPCDVTQPQEVAALVNEVLRRWNRLDVLINNAGVIGVGPVETMTLADFHEAMNVNFWGALHAIHAVLPAMKRRRTGRIVNISSIGGKVSAPHLLPYSASKFALTGLSEGLRSELADSGIVVTTVCPGLMRTGSPRNATFKSRHEAEYAWFKLSDSLPLLSMSAERAARQVLAACCAGKAEVVLSLPAKLAVKFHDAFPGLTTDILALVDRCLPQPGGVGAAPVLGKHSESAWSSNVLTTLTDRAAERNNQIAPDEAAVAVACGLEPPQ